MLARFLSYYKPHKALFILDMTVAFLASALAVYLPKVIRILTQEYLPKGDLDKIIKIFSMMLAIIIFKAIFTYIRVRWGHIMGVRMESDMRADIFSHIQKLSFTYFDNVKTGHIMSRISNDLNTIAEVAHHAPEDVVISSLILVGAFVMMFSFNSTLALLSLVPVPLMLIWGLTYGRKLKLGFRDVRKKIADINSNVENSVQGIREVKSYANEDVELLKFDGVNTHFRLAKERIYGVMAAFHSGMEFLSDFYFVWVIGAGVILIMKGKIDLADLLAFVMYVNFILKPIQRLVNFVEQLNQGAASFERFIEIMDIEPDIKDKKNAKYLAAVKGEIELKNVSFKYEKSNNWILNDVSIKIDAGKTIAIVGESGAGKSTLVSLIPRFYEPQRGEISIDGHNIMDLKQSCLRKNIGLVQQNVFLFDTTIRENILYGNPDATEEELIEASRRANILDFINSLPDKFDTLVGERGVKLSGGQKQRISIARVFLKNPPILIFDEATSSLDTESEAFIQKAMEELSVNRTTIIIAHRLSTVRNADYIYVMQKGEVVEDGTHKDLMKKEGVYQRLYTRNLF